MDLKQLFTDDDAVSPVIGVILMVAITVILAAVIGAFVLDLGGNTTSTPQVSFDFSQSGDAGDTNSEVDITHESGETLDGDKLEVTLAGSNAVSQFPSSDVGAGTSVTIDISGASSDDTIRVTWTSDSGDTSSTLADYDLE